MNRIHSFLRFLAPIALLAACSSNHPEAESSFVDASAGTCSSDTASIQAKILAPACGTAGCHAAAEPSNGLDLVSPGLEARVIGAKALGCLDQILVVAGNPDASYLLHKVSDPKPKCGSAMPLRGPSDPGLSADDIACLRAWITGLKPVDAGVTDTAPDALSDTATDTGPTCPTGQTSCSGACVDLTTNAANCGACGKACGTGQTCVGSACSCGTSGTLCSGACVDTKTSTSNCGACGKACGTGQTCSAGTCSCLGGLTACSSGCVDTTSSATNCGACGNACGTGMVCSAGKCTSSCPTGTTNCSGACVDLTKDTFNCGTCGKACPSGTSCVGGVCACPTGTKLCGTTCVNTSTDSSNCGACGTVCSTGTTCSAGTCSCGTGKTLCGGACVDTTSDPSNCGTCGTACAVGATCSAGKCACPSGQTVCGGKCVSTATDPSNCGACGVVCSGGKTCSAGVCTCGPSVSFAGAVQPIFTANCALAGCHTGIKPASSLDLSSGKAYANLVNVAVAQCGGKIRVVPASVPNSYLMNKLTGVGICYGTQMPKIGTSLPTAELNTISGWICNGAPNN